jgi:hypothetical protein
MQPTITREIIDRRQPAIRWSAILGGTAIAVGVWGVLQLMGIGAGFVAIDPDDAKSMVPAAIGATAFSTLAPLIAMFAGGWFAARFANTWDRQVASTHGLITWGLTSVIGLATTVLVSSAVIHGGPIAATTHDALLAIEKSGKGLLALGVSMMLSVVTAIAGALMALRTEEQRRPPHTTAPYPVQTPLVDSLRE